MSTRNQSSSKKDDDDDQQHIKGPHTVARGPTHEDSIEQHQHIKKLRISKMSPTEKRRLETHLHGPNAYHNQKRRNALRDDDTHMDTSKLTPPQKRALERRTKYGNTKRLKAEMDRIETKRLEAAVLATDAELILNTQEHGVLETEHDMERTTALTQNELKNSYLDEQTARQIYNLKLEQYSPYQMTYDRSGRCGILFGNRGHVSLMDCHTLSLKTEFYVNETVRDATFLHNTTMFAIAQKRHVFIYDDGGTEIHRLEDHTDPFRLQFLPYHWLLASVGRHGWLKYHDTSTGNLISKHRTKLGPCSVMRQNPTNAVIHLGHTNGTVTLWSPSSSDYLVKMLCHKGSSVRCLALDLSGHYMVTGGADSQVKIWDLRMYKETHAYYTPGGAPSTLDISQRGLLGIGHGVQTTFWKSNSLKYKVKDPYMRHDLNGCGPIESIRFRPYEDVCGIGHQNGFASIVIPGSGEPNLDTMEYNTNPYQDGKQRREAEVKSLLDKLSPDMIGLDPDVVGTVEESDLHGGRLERVRDLVEEANTRKSRDDDEDDDGEAEPKKEKKQKKEKKRMRGRDKVQKKLKRKQRNIVDANTQKLREVKEKEKEERMREKQATSKGEEGGGVVSQKDRAPTALKRFF